MLAARIHHRRRHESAREPLPGEQASAPQGGLVFSNHNISFFTQTLGYLYDSSAAWLLGAAAAAWAHVKKLMRNSFRQKLMMLWLSLRASSRRARFMQMLLGNRCRRRRRCLSSQRHKQYISGPAAVAPLKTNMRQPYLYAPLAGSSLRSGEANGISLLGGARLLPRCCAPLN